LSDYGPNKKTAARKWLRFYMALSETREKELALADGRGIFGFEWF
jgi:hypothetical protein